MMEYAENNMVGAAMVGGLARREKLWTERTAEEKLEALRCELLREREQCLYALRLAQKLMEHRHAADGVLMAPMSDNPDEQPFMRRYVPVSLRDKE